MNKYLMHKIDEIKKLAKDFNLIPIAKVFENKDTILTSDDAFLRLKKISKQCFVLDSATSFDKNGRWTFLGFNPKLEISAKNFNMTIKNGTTINTKTEHPKTFIREVLEKNKSPKIKELPPFTGGLVGYFSFDYIMYEEPVLKLDANDEENFKDIDLMLFDKVLVFDNQEKKIYIIVNIKRDSLEENYYNAITEIERIENIIFKGDKFEPKKIKIKSKFDSLFDKKGFEKIVSKAKDYIKEGDIFQVVLSNRHSAKATGNLFETYKILKEKNPSPYMFFFSSDDVEIAGSSPETLVKVFDKKVFTFPLAGSRPRGKDEKEDEKIIDDLLSDEKELAEHNMLVDLGRNDIGKIAKFGTVKVKDYKTIAKFSHIMHIGSTVEGELREDEDALSTLSAILPAGTLSGAPKIRAIEIINELENSKRGIYGGAVGYLSFNGDMDTCISIRVAYKKNDKVHIRSGAGIVYDSDPETEYLETENKLKAVRDALID